MGTTISLGAWANVVDNLFAAAGGDQKDALAVKSNARAFVTENVSFGLYFDFAPKNRSDTLRGAYRRHYGCLYRGT